METNKRRFKDLIRALKHLDVLVDIDLDDALRLVNGANEHMTAIHMLVIARLRLLSDTDPGCVLPEDIARRILKAGVR